ncbi:hypothetical protein HK097_001613, partial [Rhizophlyctis rosea]
MYLNDPVGDEETNARSTGRKYGWLEMVCGKGNVEVVVPDVVESGGYVNTVSVGAEDVRMKSSLGREEWMTLGELRIDARMPVPLTYHAPRGWDFKIGAEVPKVWFLRDHVTLLNDLVGDWSGGTGDGREYFVPVEYGVEVDLAGWEVWLCLNQGNVGGIGGIKDNAYFVLAGEEANFKVVLPFLKYEPLATEVKFRFEAQNMHSYLSFPPTSTLGNFLTDPAKHVGTLKKLDVRGAYRYLTEVKDGNVEGVDLDVQIEDITAVIFGFLLTYLVQLKDNYAGEFTEYVQKNEYMKRKGEKEKVEEERRRKRAAKGKENAFEVNASVVIKGVTMVLPENLYDLRDVQVLRGERIEVGNRNLDELQEIRVDFTPVRWFRSSVKSGGDAKRVRLNEQADENCCLTLHGMKITGHRLFGPLPKALCFAVDYRVNMESIAGDVTPEFLVGLNAAVDSLALHLMDEDNTIPSELLPDITAVSGGVERMDVRIWPGGVRHGESVVSLEMVDGVRGDWDNVCVRGVVGRGEIEVPVIGVRVLQKSSDRRQREREWAQVCQVETGIDAGLFMLESGWAEKEGKQKGFVKEEDMYGRCDFLWKGGDGDNTAARNRREGWVEWIPKFRPPFRISGEPNDGRWADTLERSRSKEWDGDDYMSSRPSRASDTDSDGPEFVFLSEGDEEGGLLKGRRPSAESKSGTRLPYDSYLRKFRLFRAKNGKGMKFLPLTVDDSTRERRDKRAHQRWGKRRRNGGVEASADDLKDEERLVLSVDVMAPVEVFVAPALGAVLEAVLTGSAKHKLDAELVLDVLQLGNMKRITRSFAHRFSSTGLYAAIPQVVVRSVQDMLLPDDGTFLNLNEIRNSRSRAGMEALVCTSEVVMDGVVLKAILKTENAKEGTLGDGDLIKGKVELDVESVKLGMEFVGGFGGAGVVGIPNKFADGGHQYPSVLDVAVTNVRGSGTVNLTQHGPNSIGTPESSEMAFTVEDIAVAGINQTAEIVFGALLTWMNSISSLSGVFTAHNERRKRTIQRYLAGVATKARKKRVDGEPYFLSPEGQINPLWADDRPKHHTDPGWRVLMDARWCLRAIGDVDKDEVGVEERDEAKMWYESVVRYFATWKRWEASDLTGTDVLVRLYGMRDDGPVPAQVEDLATLMCGRGEVTIRRVRLSIFEAGSDDNKATIGPIVVKALSELKADSILDDFRVAAEDSGLDMRRMSYMMGSMVSTDLGSLSVSGVGGGVGLDGSRYVVGANLDADVLPGQALDVAVAVEFGIIDIQVDPNILGFVGHALRVHRWFLGAYTSSEVVKSPSKNTAGNIAAYLGGMQYLLSATARVGTFKASAIAHNLVAKVAFVGLQTSTVQAGMHFDKAAAMVSGAVSGIVSATSAHASSRGFASDFPPSAVARLVHSTVCAVTNVKLVISERSTRSYQTIDDNTLIAVDVRGITATVSIGEGRWKGGTAALLPETVAIALVVRSIGIQLPRSFLKVHAFLEKWGDEDLPRFDFLLTNLAREWAPDLADGVTMPLAAGALGGKQDRWSAAGIDFQFLLSRFTIESDLLAALRFSYGAGDVMVVVDRQPVPKRSGTREVVKSSKLTYVGRLGGHEMKFLARSGVAATWEVEDHGWSSFTLPSLSSQGTVLQSTGGDKAAWTKVEADLAVDIVESAVDVSIVDQLITTQSVLGGELNDILDVFNFYRRRRSQGAKQKVSAQPVAAAPEVLYALKVTVQGIKIAAHSPASIVLLESDALNGFAMNFPQGAGNNAGKTLWRVAANRLSLSLLPKDASEKRSSALAYVMMDFTVQNYRGKLESPNLMVDNKGNSLSSIGSSKAAASSVVSLSSGHNMKIEPGADKEKTLETLFIRFHKIHMAMRPMALGVMVDLFLYYKNELTRRKEVKAEELHNIKQNAQRFLKGVNVPISEYTQSRSFLEDKIVVLRLSHIGIAIPLTDDENAVDVLAQEVDGETSDTVPAFLMSARSINFLTKRFATSSGQIRDLAVQFVPAFQHTNHRHFSPSAHPLQNRIIMRDITAEVVHKLGQDMKISVQAGIKGFELEVDASLAGYVNGLNMVYERSREKMMNSKLTVNSGTAIPNYLEPTSPVSLDGGSSTPLSSTAKVEFEGRFVFEAGTCKISNLYRGKPSDERIQTPRGADADDHAVHVLVLPGITLSTSGRTVFGDMPPLLVESVNSDAFEKALHIELVVHPSDNILHPSILIFFNDLMANLKVGSSMNRQSAHEREQARAEGGAANVAAALSAYQRHSVTFYLRLLHTTLSLSCQPTSKVVCALNLDEADFMFSFVPRDEVKAGQQFFCCTGNVLGTSASLRHAFSPEDCLRGEIPRLSFNLSMVDETSKRGYALEIGLPSVLGTLNVRHLQDYFLFEHMWFQPSASAPLAPRAEFEELGLGGGTQQPLRSFRQLSQGAMNVASDFLDSLVVAVRVNKMEFGADLGQSIGKIGVTLDSIVGSLNATSGPVAYHRRGLSLTVADIALKGEGRFSGSTSVNGINVSAESQNPSGVAVPNGRWGNGTEISIHVKRLTSQLQYQYERILILEMAPISGGLIDKWEFGSERTDLSLDMDFTIDSVKLIMSRTTIPTFFHMFERLSALIEEKKIINVPSKSSESVGEAMNPLDLLPPSAKTKHVPSLVTPPEQTSSVKRTSVPARPAFPNPTLERRKFWTLNGLDVSLSTNLRLYLGDAFIVLTRYNFRDPECAHIVTKKTEMIFKQTPEDAVHAQEETALNLTGFTIRKCSTKSISQSEERMWTTAQWFAFMTSSAAKNVVMVPPVVVSLKTMTAVPDSLVEFGFRTDFAGKIDIALNFGLYKYLKELVDLYEKAVLGGGST